MVFLLLTWPAFCTVETEHIQRIFPLASFKSVIDTCMHSYSDILLLQDKIANHEKITDALDLLVGRLIHLSSYIDQLADAYAQEALVTYEEIDYFYRLLEHLEVTLSESPTTVPFGTLNEIIEKLKVSLKDIVQCNAMRVIPMQLFPYPYPPLKDRLLLFA